MTKEEIFKELRISYRYVTAPRDINFTLENRILYVTMNEAGVLANMQDNSSTFEGWILAIISDFNKIQENISYVYLKWTRHNVENGHYNRFLYRVSKFREKFHFWFYIDNSNQIEMADFDRYFFSSNLILNIPETEGKGKPDKDGEAMMERLFKDEFQILKGVKLDVQDRQLPVGVFNEIIENENLFFTGGSSAIDLWGIEDEDNELFIFELKYLSKNSGKVGIVSELLFYLWVMEDLHINGRIKYPEVSEAILRRNIRSFTTFYIAAQGKGIKSITGVFLADKFHPLINNALVDLMNKYLQVGNIRIAKQEYSYSKNSGIKLYEPYNPPWNQ